MKTALPGGDAAAAQFGRAGWHFAHSELLQTWLQARAADEAGIQFRMLNASKGPAVRGPRAQMDRALYKKAMQQLVEQQPNLSVHDGAVTDLILQRAVSGSQASVSGVTLASGKQCL